MTYLAKTTSHPELLKSLGVNHMTRGSFHIDAAWRAVLLWVASFFCASRALVEHNCNLFVLACNWYMAFADRI
jgi:hypothetical protein